MTRLPFSVLAALGQALRCATLGAVCLCPSAWAERADRLKPLTIQADHDGQIDLQRQVIVFTGNVVVSKGTMVIRAARIEVRQSPSGYDSATAFGTAGHPATFRQKREGADEFMDGEAERLDYDGKADVIKFLGSASVRRLRGTVVADEITGHLVTYDSVGEVLRVSGGAASSPANPGGRVRAVLSPREGSEAASDMAAAAASAAGATLKSSPALPAPAASAATGARSGTPR
jgi:lipopolysaccharide export system protein LptA